MDCHASETLRHLLDDHHAVDEVLARLYRVAFRMVRNRDDAEDVVQQSLLNALRGQGTFDGRCLLTTWLHQIVRNQAHKFLSQRRRFLHEILDEETASQISFIDESMIHGRIDYARVLVMAPKLLSPTEVDLFYSHYVAGWSYTELARRTGKTSTATRQLLCRAVSKLRNYLTQQSHYEKEVAQVGGHPGRLFRRVAGRETR